MSKLICPECRHENELERVYCHECGARLDRSKVKVDKTTVEEPKETQRRLRRMLGPRWSPMQRTFFKLAKVILAACVAAVLAQMALPPDVPERPKGLMLASQVTLDLENALMSRRGAQLRYSEDDVNGFLLSALKTKQKALDNPVLKFERALAVFDTGILRLTVERSFFGYSLFTATHLLPVLQEGKLTFANGGGRLGRLRIPPSLMQYCDVLFADVGKALDREHTALKKLANVEFQPKTVVLTAPGP